MLKYINLQAFRDFLRSGQVGGILLLFSVMISLVIANTGGYTMLNNLWSSKTGFESSTVHLNYSISGWINDGLMAIFFLLVGLEIKREVIEGELSDPQKAALPVFAAIGGMLIPALLFYIINSGRDTSHGWGIPMATDIAFALTIVSALGRKVPHSLKIFMAALAIADDLGAILVIALFYSDELHINQLLYAAGIMALLVLLNLMKVRKLIYYIIPGIFLWYFIHHSGIHATIAGVLLALTIPSDLEKAASPLQKMEHFLNAPVNYLILPLFALANTNIHFEANMFKGLTSPLGTGIIAGLVLGKPIGISLFSWLSVKLKFSILPHNSSWIHIIGIGMLAGIGFTMSIFISMLSLNTPKQQLEAKLAVLLASVFAGISGYLFFTFLNTKKTQSGF